MREISQKFKYYTLIVVALVIGVAIFNTGLLEKDSEVSTSVDQGKQTLESNENRVRGETSERVGVSRIIDGDTIEIDSGKRVRLIGIDSPERGAPFYFESKKGLEDMILKKQIRLEKDVSETDKYGRLLRYIYLENTFVNLEMLKQGYAVAWTVPPDVKNSSKFISAEKEAREKGLGVWATANKDSSENRSERKSESSIFSLPPCADSDCDCSDFSSHRHAQWFHDNHDPFDRHRLDRDKDGLACESI